MPCWPCWVEAWRTASLAARMASERRVMAGVSAGWAAKVSADTLVVFTTDHYNLFFELCVPIFAIGVAERSAGPSDYPMLAQFDVAIDGELAAAIQTAVVAEGFDLDAIAVINAGP